MIKPTRFLPAAALAAAIALFAPAASAGLVKIGVLSCHIDGGVGMVLYSHKTLRCNFRRTSGRREHYTGSVTRLGVDLGETTGTSLIWSVFAPGSTRRGALAGTYVGASAEVTPGAGYGANALIGGLRHGIVLQPVSFQAQTGLNIAAGIAGLSLRPAR